MNTKSSIPMNFLFATWEGGGNVAPALTVARQLRQRGHRVRFLCDEAARRDALAHDIGFRPWQTAPNRPDRSPASCPVRDWEATDPIDGIKRLLDHIMIGPALHYAQDVLAELDREPADLVVTSEMLPGVMAGCESRQQPFAVLAANLCLYPIHGMPAFGPGLAPARTPEDFALHAEIDAANLRMFDLGLDSFNQTRLHLRLPPLNHVADQIKSASLYLLGTSRAFDFAPQELPERIHYIGPQLDEPGWTEPWQSPWPATDQSPIIVVGFSTTFQDHAQALQNVIDGAARLPARLLVTTGQIHPSDLIPAPNTVLVPSVPHNQVMQQAAVVVTHGGHGTVMRSLIHKRPLLIMPHGRDQPENAIRVTERGAGLCLPPNAAPDQIESALQQLLQNPAFARAAARLGSQIAHDINHSPAIPLLENLAAQTKHHSRLAC